MYFYYLFIYCSEEAIKCCTDDESFAVFSKIEEPSKATLACIICFLKYMCSCEEKTKVNETALAGIFSSCIMKCPYTDMKMMISATEKQTSFTLGLLDAVGSKLIVSKDFEKIVKKDDKTPEKVSEPQLSTNSNNEKKNRTESIENITVKPAEAKEKKKVSAKKPGDLPKSEAIVLPRTPRTPCIKVFGDGDVDAYNMEADVDKDDVTELEFFIDEKRRTVVTSDSENEGDEDPFDNGDGTPLSSPPPPVQQQQQQQKKKKPTQSHPHKQSESKKKSRSKRETSKISKPSEK